MPPKKNANARGDKNLTQKSPAEFFQDNKGIAGFENAGKSLYTTLREFIENALDAAEAIGTLPEIDIAVEEVSVSQYENLIGLKAHVRLDDELYADFESDKAKAKRLAQEAKAAAKAAATSKRGGGGGKREQTKCFYKITVKDNGKGMQHEDIPNMLGRVLSGTKYGVRQTRGKFGLGSKMALIWSKQTTGLPIRVRSALPNQSFISEYALDIDIEKNEPNIHKENKLPNDDKWHGAELSVTIEGNWTTYRQYVLSYMRQLAIVTPYAQFRFRFMSSAATTSHGERHRHRLQTTDGHHARAPVGDQAPPDGGEGKHAPHQRFAGADSRKDFAQLFTQGVHVHQQRSLRSFDSGARVRFRDGHASERGDGQAGDQNSAIIGGRSIRRSERFLPFAGRRIQLAPGYHERARPGVDCVLLCARSGLWRASSHRRGVRFFGRSRGETRI